MTFADLSQFISLLAVCITGVGVYVALRQWGISREQSRRTEQTSAFKEMESLLSHRINTAQEERREMERKVAALEVQVGLLTRQVQEYEHVIDDLRQQLNSGRSRG